jgi:hypothetical protein
LSPRFDSVFFSVSQWWGSSAEDILHSPH